MSDSRIELLNKYILEEPDNPFNRYALAMEYYERQPEKATQLLDELLSDQPSYLPTYFKAAHLFWELEEWNRANDVFKKGIDLANQQKDEKAIKELSSAYQNFKIDMDPA